MAAMTGDRLPISIIVLTYDEEANIEACLRSVCDWAGEVFVVDSGSTDRTLEIAARYTDKIVTHPFENYSRQRNWAQETLPLSYQWALHLDADEQVSDELAQSMKAAFQGDVSSIDGFLINRRALFLGRWIRHGGVYPTYHHRLYRVNRGFCEDREYDQHFAVKGNVVKLKGDILNDVTPDLSTWTRSHERWASMEAREYLKGYRPDIQHGRQVQAKFLGTPIERRRWLRLQLYGRVPLFVRGFIYFFVRYLLQLGFLDGVQGLIFHVLQGFWYRFYVDAKIWEAQYQASQTVRDVSTDS